MLRRSVHTCLETWELHWTEGEKISLFAASSLRVLFEFGHVPPRCEYYYKGLGRVGRTRGTPARHRRDADYIPVYRTRATRTAFALTVSKNGRE